METVRLYVRFTRPFTLLPPLLGVVSGAVTAWGSATNPHVLAGEPRRVSGGQERLENLVARHVARVR